MKQKSALVRFLIVLVGLIVIGLVAVAPTPDGLSGQGKLALVIFLVAHLAARFHHHLLGHRGYADRDYRLGDGRLAAVARNIDA